PPGPRDEPALPRRPLDPRARRPHLRGRRSIRRAQHKGQPPTYPRRPPLLLVPHHRLRNRHHARRDALGRGLPPVHHRLDRHHRRLGRLPAPAATTTGRRNPHHRHGHLLHRAPHRLLRRQRQEPPPLEPPAPSRLLAASEPHWRPAPRTSTHARAQHHPTRTKITGHNADH